MTVPGDVPAEKLGFCQSHEHVFLAKGHSYSLDPALCIDDAKKSASELALYKNAGGAALVDAQPIGCGRDAEALRLVFRESGVHIVASTGFHKLVFYPEDHWIFKYGGDRLTRLFIKELTDGMYTLCDRHEPERQSGSRAGQIKTALDACGIAGEYAKLFEAAAAAAVETGRALMAHIEPGADPVALADFLESSGLDLNRVVFCHMDRAVWSVPKTMSGRPMGDNNKLDIKHPSITPGAKTGLTKPSRHKISDKRNWISRNANS